GWASPLCAWTASRWAGPVEALFCAGFHFPFLTAGNTRCCAHAARMLREMLPDHTGNAARLADRAGDAILEVADRGCPDIAGTHIGPGSACLFSLAGGLAGLPIRIGRYVDMPQVTAVTVKAEFEYSGSRLDDAGTADAR